MRNKWIGEGENWGERELRRVRIEGENSGGENFEEWENLGGENWGLTISWSYLHDLCGEENLKVKDRQREGKPGPLVVAGRPLLKINKKNWTSVLKIIYQCSCQLPNEQFTSSYAVQKLSWPTRTFGAVHYVSRLTGLGIFKECLERVHSIMEYAYDKFGRKRMLDASQLTIF